jgi:hypothetical protein
MRIFILGILPLLSISESFAATGQEHPNTPPTESIGSGKEDNDDKLILKEGKKDIKAVIKSIEKGKDSTDTDIGEINKAIIQLYKIQ